MTGKQKSWSSAVLPSDPVLAAALDCPVATIIEELRLFGGEFPARAWIAAILKRDEMTSRLLAEIEAGPQEILARIESVDSPDRDYSLHLFAIFLLAVFEEKRAWRPLLDFYSDASGLGDYVTGDLATMDLAWVLARVHDGGDIEPLIGLIERPVLDCAVRNAAADALWLLVRDGKVDRGVALRHMQGIFQRLIPADGVVDDEDTGFWTFLSQTACHFQAPELTLEVERCFALGLIDERFFNRADMTAALAMTEAAIEEEYRPRDRIDNLGDYLSNGIGFFLPYGLQPCERATRTDDDIAVFEALMARLAQHRPLFASSEPYVRSRVKVGRNEPCPCGSGRKHKKCCLGADTRE